MLKIIYILLYSIILLCSIVFYTLLAKQKTEYGHPKICTSFICLKESVEIYNNLNLSVDRCENFYEFVCGKFIHSNVMPDNEIYMTSLSIAQEQVTIRMKEVLLEDLQSNEPKAFKLVKTLTRMCMDEATLNKNGKI